MSYRSKPRRLPARQQFSARGLDQEHARQLFRPFHRLHADLHYEGIGSGLASVQRILRRHDGRIWASAMPGRGATFYFTLRG